MNFWLLLPAVPMLAQTGLVALLTCGSFWWGRPRFDRGLLVLPWRKGFGERWRYTTTIGLAMGTHDPNDVSDELIYHEQIHVRQYVDMGLLGLILGGLVCLADWRWGLGVWATSGPLWLLPNFLTGWIRFGDPYLGAEHERSAYAQTSARFDGRDEWWER